VAEIGATTVEVLRPRAIPDHARAHLQAARP
jgi:hypothetical protein